MDDKTGKCCQTDLEWQGRRLTFSGLIKEVREQAVSQRTTLSVMASNEAALRNFARTLGQCEDDNFTTLLGVQDSHFDQILRSYEEKATVSVSTIASYRSRLRSWNASARSLVQTVNPEPALFAEVLSKALAEFQKANPGINRTAVAGQAGISLRLLYQWTKPGASQASERPEHVVAARQLEAILGLSRGALTSRLVPKRRKGKRHADVVKERKRRHSKIAFTKIKFRPTKLPGQIGRFFERLKLIKTTAQVLRNATGTSIKRADTTWRVTPQSDTPVPAAKMMEQRWLTYCGWLMLPDNLDDATKHVIANSRGKKESMTPERAKALAPYFIGKGAAPHELTPAHLVDPELMGEFIEWSKKRHGTVMDQYIRDAIALLEPKAGFLAQQVEYAWDYKKTGIKPIDMSALKSEAFYAEAAKSWTGKCATLITDLKGLLPFTSNGNTRTARNRLKPILDQADLMSVVTNIIENHAADRPMGKLIPGWHGSVHLAVWVRDQLLLRMLASNPLRNRNFREMRYLSNPTSHDRGNLLCSADGGWRILFQPEDFKNERGAANEIYDVPVPKDIHPLMALYLTKARPILAKSTNPTDRVFITRDGKPLSTTGLSSIVVSLTARHVQDDVDSLGFGTHAFRHIIPTSWLRAHPKDFLTVAHILHDSLRTVLENYAHDKPSDGLNLYSSWLSTKIPALILKNIP